MQQVYQYVTKLIDDVGPKTGLIYSFILFIPFYHKKSPPPAGDELRSYSFHLFPAHQQLESVFYSSLDNRSHGSAEGCGIQAVHIPEAEKAVALVIFAVSIQAAFNLRFHHFRRSVLPCGKSVGIVPTYKADPVAVFLDQSANIIADLYRGPGSPATVDHVLYNILRASAAMVNRNDPSLDTLLCETLVVRFDQFPERLGRHEQGTLCRNIIKVGDGNENPSELLPTLCRFARDGFSQAETAKQLHIHLNTLKYRLKRISSLTGMTFHDHRENFYIQLSAALYLKKTV